RPRVVPARLTRRLFDALAIDGGIDLASAIAELDPLLGRPGSIDSRLAFAVEALPDAYRLDVLPNEIGCSASRLRALALPPSVVWPLLSPTPAPRRGRPSGPRQPAAAPGPSPLPPGRGRPPRRFRGSGAPDAHFPAVPAPHTVRSVVALAPTPAMTAPTANPA